MNALALVSLMLLANTDAGAPDAPKSDTSRPTRPVERPTDRRLFAVDLFLHGGELGVGSGVGGQVWIAEPFSVDLSYRSGGSFLGGSSFHATELGTSYRLGGVQTVLVGYLSAGLGRTYERHGDGCIGACPATPTSSYANIRPYMGVSGGFAWRHFELRAKFIARTLLTSNTSSSLELGVAWVL